MARRGLYWDDLLGKGLKNRRFLEKPQAQNLQNLVQAAVDLEFLLDDRDQDVGADGNPDLRLHGGLGRAIKGLDAQMLLDPFEEKFHLPAALVQFSNRQRVQDKVVGEKHQALAGIRIDILDTSQGNRIFGCRLDSCKPDGLIAAQPRRFVYRTIRPATVLEVLLGTRDEESHVRLKDIQRREMDVTPVHDIERAGFHGKKVEGLDIGHFPRGNVDKTGDVAAQVDQRVQFDGSLASAKACPWEEGQTEVDRRGIESVNGLLQIHAQRVARIKFAGLRNEKRGEIGIDAPVAVLIGLGQCVACDLATNADVIQFGLHGVQTDFDVAQAGSVGQLSKGHTQELIEARKLAGAIVASVFADAAVEIALGQEGHQLRKQKRPGVHRQVLSTVFRGKYYQNAADQVEIDAAKKTP